MGSLLGSLCGPGAEETLPRAPLSELDDCPPLPAGFALSHAQIGALMGLSPRRVQQIEQAALAKLRHAMCASPACDMGGHS